MIIQVITGEVGENAGVELETVDSLLIDETFNASPLRCREFQSPLPDRIMRLPKDSSDRRAWQRNSYTTRLPSGSAMPAWPRYTGGWDAFPYRASSPPSRARPHDEAALSRNGI